ncbi:CLUMA_CG002752, isoform A [Clunio marinus]|uniref:CLUMA_CG002752, isoform A n=1 Tax=Clunio marinus TaxID=568069 RepID=A0A1J1HN69_9DIPT|nr:CLUMA_CG002752, isoform A [Clunio marinus]
MKIFHISPSRKFAIYVPKPFELSKEITKARRSFEEFKNKQNACDSTLTVGNLKFHSNGVLLSRVEKLQD